MAIICEGLFLAALQAQPNRLTTDIDNRRTAVLAGRVHAQVAAAADLGAAEDSLPMPGMMLVFKPTAAQQADLDGLLAAQRDPTSASFHQWLTPEQYADRFGISAGDLARVRTWLAAQGFTVREVARSRTWILFDGTAGLASAAFRTSIHRYLTDGQTHYANRADPALPTALAGIISNVRGLHDFRMRSHVRVPVADYTVGSTHYLGPDDVATIYDIAPLYKAGIDGSGQSVAIVGQTRISTSDLSSYRGKFGLSSITLKQILVGSDPGVSSSTDLAEADLDLEMAGAVARGATLVYVYSSDVYTSATYAVDHAVAPVMSMSYGSCEGWDVVDLPSMQQLAQQANAQGMTWVTAAGDRGAADCELTSGATAQTGLTVDAPASVPEVTGIGGTEFNEQSGTYWGSNGTTLASALSYIPEKVWNDTSSSNGLAAGGGGRSAYFAQPSWQKGPGVPSDGYRHVPDVAFAASGSHDGYYIYSNSTALIAGGTSAAAPLMAGVLTLLNQYLVSQKVLSQAGLGNVNPTLYRLAQSTSGVFHDVTTGSNAVPCLVGSPDCTTGTMGYNAAAGYDMATGLGSLDVYQFVTQWSTSVATAAAVAASIDQNPVFETNGAWTFKLTLTEEAGIAATLTGFTIDGTSYSSQIASLFGGSAMAALGSVSAKITLTSVAAPKTVTFVFSGIDATGNAWSATLPVAFSAAQTALAVSSVANAASYQKSYAPGMLVAVFGSNFGTSTQAAGTVPLPDFMAGFEAYVNGVSAPLWYVSPTQANIQIPYETSTGAATLTVGNPWDNYTYSIRVSAAAPGIFTFSDGFVNPTRSAARGDTVTLYITGEGKVSPAVATGSAPSSSQVPKPTQSYSLTVGGAAATIKYIGIPSWSVGVTQVNFVVPTTISTGVQPVVMTVGGVASATASMTVN